MNFFRVLRARLIGFWRKEQLERELDEELRFHLAMRAKENIERGMSPGTAAREAQRRFGNTLRVKDAWRDIAGGGALDSFVHDLRFAMRTLRKDRVFTFVAVAALTIGIGANTALFTVLSDVLLRPLPYSAPAEILSISMRDRTNPQEPFPFSYPDFRDFRERLQTVTHLGAYRAGSFVVRSDGGPAARVPGAWVTPDVFPVLGVKPALGRQFVRAEEEPGGQRVALISDVMWQERYARAANITQATLTVNGLEYRIIGVMPAGFRFPVQNDPAQFWITFASELAPGPDGSAPFPTRRDSHFVRLLGRLKAGATQAEASAELDTIAAQLAVTYPATNQNYDACIVRPMLEEITRRVRPVLLVLIGAAFFTLCVACANVANLLLARGSTRRKEIAVRAALGAGRHRIFRQLLTESLLLALLGGASGLLLAIIGTHYIVAMLPHDFPRAAEIAPDANVLAFNLAITLMTSCLFGVVPGWRFARAELAPLLHDGTPQSSEPPVGRRTRNTLVVVELVLAFVLLAGASFFISHLAHLQASPLGFDPARVATLNIVIPDDKRADLPQHIAGLVAETTRRIAQLDGVEGVSAVSLPPVTPALAVADFAIAGREIPPPDLPLAEPRIVGPGYFATMRIALQAGRDFAATDKRTSAPVVIVNETLAKRFFPGESALGRRITPGLYADPLGPVEREIIGIVADVQSDLSSPEPRPQLYVPLTQCVWLDLTLVARSNWPPEDLLFAIEDVVTDLDPNVAVAERGTMAERVARAAATPRMNSTLLSLFAAVAVGLTAIGVYGVMAYSVAQRRHDLGIRLALGAQKRDVFRLVLREGVRLIACAIVLGAAITVSLLPVLHRVVGDSAPHVSIVCITAIFLSVVALLACWIPARRAASLDPLAALEGR